MRDAWYCTFNPYLMCPVKSAVTAWSETTAVLLIIIDECWYSKNSNIM